MTSKSRSTIQVLDRRAKRERGNRRETPGTEKGSELFDNIGYATCHVRPLTNVPVGAKINGGTFTIPDALAGKTSHLIGDFLVLDVRTGDGIVMAIEEHFGRNVPQIQWKNLSLKSFVSAQHNVGTAPL